MMSDPMFPTLRLTALEPSVLEGQSVLVVDSQPPVKFAAAIALREAGAKVFFACDATEAVFRLTMLLAASKPFALIIVSLNDPASLGTVRRLREAGYRGPVLGVGHDDLDHAAQAAGVDDMLHLPLDPETLEQTAARLTTAHPHTPLPPSA